MIIKSLTVKNFRNIAYAEFSFDKRINIFTGSNAQGKTNICEAVSLCFGKSFRNPKAAELIPFNSNNEEISLELTFSFDSLPDKDNLIIYTQKGSNFKLTFNGLEMKSAEELYGALRYVIFIPEDLYIVKGNPEKRRDYIDFVSNMINRVHNSKLYEYNKALRQKNNLLYNLSGYDRDYSSDMLESWNDTLAKLGVNVMCGRLKYFSTLSAYAADFYGRINKSDEKLTMRYESSVMEDISYTAEDWELMYETYRNKLRETFEKELKMKYTVVGAHRDDISFFIDNIPSKDFASQGQIRSIAVSLKLAEARMIYEKSGDVPIIILDDVLSELDRDRRAFITNHIDNFQTFITSCNISDIKELASGKVWRVEKGRFSEIKV